MTPDELRTSVESTLGPLSAAYRGPADASDLYEAALFVTAVQAAEQAGGRCLLTADDKNPATELTFRRHSSRLWTGNFTYSLVSFPDRSKQLEIHLGVYVVGTSGAVHESDVAILERREARRSRGGGLHPRQSGLIASIEAKNYVASPGIGVGRGFLGLSTEFGPSKCSLAFRQKKPARLQPSSHESRVNASTR